MQIKDIFKKKISIYALLILIMVLAIFLRTYNINDTPPGIYPDEAVNGQDAIRANETGNYQWFYEANQGREGLFMNLIALCFKLFGISIFTLKLPAIFFGSLTVLGTYLLSKEIFQKERIAIISAFLIAVSFWAINFSRISFRANMLPFVLVFTFYFLFRGVRTKKYLPFIFGGLIFGIGTHTYIAFRIAPLIIALLIVSFIISKQNFLKEYWKHLLIFFTAMIIAASPMLYTFYQHPEFLESRSSSISVLSPEVNQGNLAKTFLTSFGLSLVKFNFFGDQNWRHGYPPYPILDPITGVAFLFGFFYSLTRIVRLIQARFSKHLRNPELNIHILLFAWFFAMLVPEFMTAEGLPHALRSIGTLPAVIIFSAITFDFFLEKLEKKSAKKSVILLLFILASIGLFNGIKYHYFWAKKTEVAFSFNKNLTDMAKYIQTLPSEKEKFIITSYNTIEKAPIEILTTKNNTRFLFPNELHKIPQNNSDVMFFFTEKNNEAIAEINSRFPNLSLEKIQNGLGSTYYILK